MVKSQDLPTFILIVVATRLLWDYSWSLWEISIVFLVTYGMPLWGRHVLALIVIAYAIYRGLVTLCR